MSVGASPALSDTQLLQPALPVMTRLAAPPTFTQRDGNYGAAHLLLGSGRIKAKRG